MSIANSLNHFLIEAVGDSIASVVVHRTILATSVGYRALSHSHFRILFSKMTKTFGSHASHDNEADPQGNDNYEQGNAAVIGPVSRSLQATTAWTLVQLTDDIGQTALDSVRYKKNYNKTVTTRLCLHYINTVRQRVDSDLTWYLLSVDGCEVKLNDASTGRCDLYDKYCNQQPYTYELKLQQRALRSSVYIVMSVFKEMTQKASGVILGEDSNLDFISYDDEEAGPQPSTLTLASNPDLLQFDSNIQLARSSSSDTLPQRLQTLLENNSVQIMLVSIGFVFGIVVAMVVARVRFRNVRTVEPRPEIRCHIQPKSYTHLEPDTSQLDL